MGRYFKQVGPSLDEMRVAAGGDASPHVYPKTLSPEERKTAAENIRKELRGKTGQERAEKRAELMDPGPSDDASYEGEERKAIQGESTGKGSTSFNYGHNTVKAQIAAKASKNTPSWSTHTPKNYERAERAAIKNESKSKGSVKFP